MNDTKTFLLLIDWLKTQSKETRAMFLAEPDSELIKAYQEGMEAQKLGKVIEKNPYRPKTSNLEASLYDKHACWNEGYLYSFVNED